jgi:hypothetical protein
MCLLSIQEVRHNGTGSQRLAIAPADYYENQVSADKFARAFIKPGTMVVSSMGTAINHMTDVVGGKHLIVDHSKFSTNPKIWVHANHIEGRHHLLKTWMNWHGLGNRSKNALLSSCAYQYVWE